MKVLSTKKYYRLIGKDPTIQTYLFLQGLIEYITSKDPNMIFVLKELVPTLYDNTIDSTTNLLKDLQSNSIEMLNEKRMVLDVPKEEPWNLWPLYFSDLQKIWVSKWICLFIVGI